MWGNPCLAVFYALEQAMDAIIRVPDVRVKITRPNWKNETSLEEFTIVTFEPRPCTDEEKSKAKERWIDPQDYNAFSDALLSYSYAESRQSVDSPFTLSLTPEEDLNGLTWLDKIAPFDLVYIEEWGKVRYCGIVHRVRYSARMGEGPERTIMVEGNGFGELLKIFHLVLDIKLFINNPDEIDNIMAKSEFISKADTSLEAAMLFYYNHFKAITLEKNNKQSVLSLLIEEKISLKVDKNCTTLLPICQSMYQMGVNTLWDIFRKIVPDPMYNCSDSGIQRNGNTSLPPGSVRLPEKTGITYHLTKYTQLRSRNTMSDMMIPKLPRYFMP
jgi:hypothetical protein